MFELAAGTIRRYIHAYNEAGLEGLRPGYGQGRPLAVDWSKAQWLDLLAQSPADLVALESGDQNWSQALLCRYRGPSTRRAYTSSVPADLLEQSARLLLSNPWW